MKKTLISWILFGCFGLFLGCFDSGLDVYVNFKTNEGLQATDNVVFESNTIGQVSEVTFTQDGKYQVKIHIESNFKNAVTQYSDFRIIEDPRNESRKAVEVVLRQPGGTVLADGSVVEGLDRPEGFFKRLKKQIQQGVHELTEDMDQGMKKLSREFDQLADDLRRIPEGESVQKFQKEMNRLAREMRKSGEQAKETFRTEVLPKLQSEIEKLRKKLKEIGREDEMKPLDKEMENLKTI